MTAAEKEYGGALFSLAADEHLEDIILEGICFAKAQFAENPAYPKLLQNPAVKKQERLAMLDTAFHDAVHPYVLNFLKILCEKSSLSALSGCEAEYRRALYAARGIVPVTATSAAPLTQMQCDALQQTLTAKIGKTVLLTHVVDATLLGGVKISYAGKELDGSVSGRLASMRRLLMAQS
ncbi:MAG: ATP synthase F1 subunit delta [Ruthenibacterium sp.]